MSEVNDSTLVKYAKQLIALDDQLDDIKEHIKEIKAQAKSEGIEVKHLTKVVAERKKDRDAIEEEEDMLRVYRDAVRGKI